MKKRGVRILYLENYVVEWTCTEEQKCVHERQTYRARNEMNKKKKKELEKNHI